MTEKLEPLSDHPLFRALVLMGGGLALSCGGSVSADNGAGTNPVLVSGMGGRGGSSGDSAITAGSGGTAGIDTVSLPCPSAQWDCSSASSSNVPSWCNIYADPAMLPAGCVCDPKRPTSASDCQANESLLCMQGMVPSIVQTTWDGTAHVQCSCVPTPPPGVDAATAACSSVFPSADPFFITAYLPPGTTCDSSGTVCTATSADILRQDGIMCGCANLGLK
ncbi:MAG TPA: hypothetical protein VGM29_08565 [Polyangiaceae bacterium]|jgi:hypothetical protein